VNAEKIESRRVFGLWMQRVRRVSTAPDVVRTVTVRTALNVMPRLDAVAVLLAGRDPTAPTVRFSIWCSAFCILNL